MGLYRWNCGGQYRGKSWEQDLLADSQVCKVENSHLWKQRRKVTHVYVDQFLLTTSYIAVKCVCLCEVETAKRRPK